MAKWGEGDPRWIVEERADATNVNNWHWTEKNATPWSKDKLKSLLDGFVIQDSKYFCEIKEVTKIEGEASANNRKAKLFFFYEWEIKADWKGKLKAGSESYKGEIEILNLSEEHLPEDVDINVTLKDGSMGNSAYEVKEFMRSEGIMEIRKQLATYIRELKEEFCQGMILPTRELAPSNDSNAARQGSAVKKAFKDQENAKDGQHWLEVQGGCKTHDETVDFKCSVDQLYRAFLDKQMVEAFTHGPAVVEPKKHGKFSMFGDNITGEFTNLEENRRIEMKWRSKIWPSAHHSTVVIELDQRDDGTLLTLHQSGIPGSDYERTVEGWRNYYWQSMKQIFGFGALLF